MACDVSIPEQVQRLASFSKIDISWNRSKNRNDKSRSRAQFSPAVLSSAGLMCGSDSRIICDHCSFEPNLEQIFIKLQNVCVSSTFLLLIEHLKANSHCRVAILCLESCVSVERNNYKLQGLIPPQKYKSLSRISNQEPDDESFEADGPEIQRVPVQQPCMDSLSFEWLRRKCTDPKNMKTVKARLLTFEKWTFSNIVTPLALACDGFYRYKTSTAQDSVKCAHCGLVLCQWDDGDIPSTEHHNKNRSCAFKMNDQHDDASLDDKEILYHRYLSFFTNKQSRTLFSLSHNKFGEFFTTLAEVFAVKENLMLTDDQLFRKIQKKNSIYLPEESLKCVRSEMQLLHRNPLLALNSSSKEFKTSPDSLNLVEVKKKKTKTQSLTSEQIKSEMGRLNEENSRLLESKLCKICIDKNVDTVFLPCGHLVSCQGCAPKLKNCAVCRTVIRGTVLAFIPDE